MPLLALALQILTLSTAPDRVTGGDVLVRIELADSQPLTVQLNGRDITSSFRPAGRSLLGLVTGLRLGANTLTAGRQQLALTNFPAAGPVFSGPHQQPFVCESASFPLPDGGLLGPPLDADCTARTEVTYMYRPSPYGPLKTLPSLTALPVDVARTTTTLGRTVPYIVRIETGTRNRAIYQTAILHDPTSEPPPSPFAPPAAWNQRLLYSFGGGCTGGWYRQGGSLNLPVSDDIVGRGYAEAAATLNVFGTNCQDVTAAETMMMVKERFIESYGPPRFTFGRGGSGGAYQQIQIADNYPGLLDGIIPSATFPEVLETTQFLTDAQLLDAYFSRSSLTDTQKRAINGHANLKNISGTAGGAGRINPEKFCPPQLPAELRYHPVFHRAGARCDIFDHNVNVYGRDPLTGFARRAVDNTGVQYGLAALNSGVLSPAEFLDLNDRIGGYDNDGNLVPTRAVADPAAVKAAYQTGRITHGGLGLAKVPIIDVRVYQDASPSGDVHLKYHSYAFRERLRRANGTLANYVMLLSDNTHNQAGYAITKMDEWLTAGVKPADLVDACHSPAGERIVEPQTFTGGRCNEFYPTYPSPRMVAGGPVTNDVLKCQLKPIDLADYKVPFTPAERERLARTFPTGVCDWSKPGVEQQKPLGTWLRY
jgi:hypothetical protein